MQKMAEQLGQNPILKRIWSTFFRLVVTWLTERPSVRTDSGGGGWETKEEKGGVSRKCSFEARMGEFSQRETFVQPAFIPLTFVTFERVFTISDEQRDKEHERAREKRRRNLRNSSEESLERSRGRSLKRKLQ